MDPDEITSYTSFTSRSSSQGSERYQPSPSQGATSMVRTPAAQATTFTTQGTNFSYDRYHWIAPQANTARLQDTHFSSGRYRWIAPQATTSKICESAPQANTSKICPPVPQGNTFKVNVSAHQAKTSMGHGLELQAKNSMGHASALQVKYSMIHASALQAKNSMVHASALQASTSKVNALALAAKNSMVHASALQTNTSIVLASTLRTANISKVRALNEPKTFITEDDDNMLCKTCKKPYGAGKIFQCKNGHSCCEGCKNSNMTCKICNSSVTNMRNFDLEKYIIVNCRVKCPNAKEGCILMLKICEISEHEKECSFKEIKCPVFENCNWRGKIFQLSSHFDENHSSSRQATVGTEMALTNIGNEYNSMQLIKIGTYNFLFRVNVSKIERKICMGVQLLGTEASASQWTYEIHVYNKKATYRKFQYVDRCRPFEEIPISLSRCAVLPLSYAMSFLVERNLTFKFFLRKI